MWEALQFLWWCQWVLILILTPGVYLRVVFILAFKTYEFIELCLLRLQALFNGCQFCSNVQHVEAPQPLEDHSQLRYQLWESNYELERLRQQQDDSHSIKIELMRTRSQVTALQMQLDGIDTLKQRNRELHLQVRALEDTLATVTEIPEGRLVLRGRLVVADRHLAVIPKIGKPFKVLKTPTWEYAGNTGDEVILEATWNTNGWEAWMVQVVKLAADLQPLDKAIVEKLTTIRKKASPGFDELDLDAAQNVTRTASHSKSAITLHVVLPTHRRFGLTEAQADSLKRIVVELVEEIDLGQVAAVEVGHTEGGRDRDHLHLLVSAWPHTGKSIGEAIGRLKALSSKRLRVAHPELPEKLWSASYWVSSAGGSLDKVVAYINANESKNLDED